MKRRKFLQPVGYTASAAILTHQFIPGTNDGGNIKLKSGSTEKKASVTVKDI